MRTVIVLCTRPPIKPGNEWNKITSCVIDENERPITNPWTSKMKLKHIRKLFGDSHKVYYLGEWTQGEPVRLIQPIRLEDWE